MVRQLRASGAVILGKLNLTEFAAYVSNNQQSGNSSLGGQVLNPYDASTDPGGSSAGSGVAAAAGLAALTDRLRQRGLDHLARRRRTASSASARSTGLWSRSGVVPISETQDTLGPARPRPSSTRRCCCRRSPGTDPDDPRTRARR